MANLKKIIVDVLAGPVLVLLLVLVVVLVLLLSRNEKQFAGATSFS